jgi:hypothetical protein
MASSTRMDAEELCRLEGHDEVVGRVSDKVPEGED